MASWTADELERIGRAEELRIASRRADGSLRPFITIWASALIVMLVAVSTGQLVLGLTLIVAFGIGMAAVLGGLAVATTWLRAAVLRGGGLARHPLVGRLAGWVPLASGTAVTMAGAVLAFSAVARLA